METPLVKVAVFGAGRIGREHIKNLLQETNVGIGYIVEWSSETLASLQEEFPLLQCNTRCQCKFLLSAEEDKVFEDNDVRAVVIASPTPQHEQQLMKSIKSKKVIFCEKPLSTSFDAVKKLLALAQKESVPIMLGFNKRSDPSIHSVRAQVQAGDIGKVHIIKICSRDPELPPAAYLKTSAGFVHDASIHDLDLACWIANGYPSEIYAAGFAHFESVKIAGDIDTLVVTIKFPSGILAVIDLSRAASYGFDQRLEIFGEKGMLSVTNQPGNSTVLASSSGFLGARPQKYFLQRYAAAYQKEIQHFIKMVRDGIEPLTSLEAILKNGYLADAVVESLRTGNSIALNYENV